MSASRQFNRTIVFGNNSNTIGNLFITGGNVGITNTAPQFSVDVSGTLDITSGSLIAPSNSNTIGNLFTTGGNVGINTTNPSYKLDVTGNCRTILTNNTAVLVGGPTATYDPCLIVLNSSGTLQIGVAHVNGSYSTSSLAGDAVIRSASDKRLLLQCGSGNAALCLTTNGNVGIGTTSQNTRLSITPASVEPKITFYDNGDSANHYGLGISAGQMNYHVYSSITDHVFYAGGKNGNGTELFRIKGTGLLQSPNFTLTTVYTNNTVDWNNVQSSNFTVGTGTKMLKADFSWWIGSPNVLKTVYFDIYTSGGTLVTTLSQVFWFNQGSMHTSGAYTNFISNATMGAGTYYMRFRHDSVSDANDYMRVFITTFPF